MKESCGEGLAKQTGPETCEATRKGAVGALIEEGVGRVFSRERITRRSADSVRQWGKPYRRRRFREALSSSGRSETPNTY
jgi:hypothetical protein